MINHKLMGTTVSAFPTIGEATYLTPGTFSWTAPAGVTSISVVAIGGGGGGLGSSSGGHSGGGGGLGWKNNIPVTPGQQYSVVVGTGGNGATLSTTDGGSSYFINISTVAGLGGGRGIDNAGALGGSYAGEGGGSGGSTISHTSSVDANGAGGAGGYSGNGGDGGAINTDNAQPGQGGGGGGGGAGNSGYRAGAGGGVGIFGEGISGTAGSYGATTGGAGGGGSNGSSGSNLSGGVYGGGGAGQDVASSGDNGGQGAVRIIWPGTLRQFPSLNTAELASAGEILVTSNDTDSGNTASVPPTAFSTNSNDYYDYIIPFGIESISAIAIGAGGGGAGGATSSGSGGGGGALVYINNVAVTPGEILRIHVGPAGYNSQDGAGGRSAFPSGITRQSDSTVLLKAIGGGCITTAGTTGNAPGGAAANCIGDVAYSGGVGGSIGSATGGGGGGAAGYAADGNTGLGGSGNWGGTGNQSGRAGGGVGPYGIGSSGTALGQGGSGGTNGTTGTSGGVAGNYGGGGGGGDDDLSTTTDPDGIPASGDEVTTITDYNGSRGGYPCVRIVYGENRVFPDTNLSEAASTLITTITR